MQRQEIEEKHNKGAGLHVAEENCNYTVEVGENRA